MRLDVESLRDFLQYYSGHFVKGREPDNIYLVVGASRERPNAVLMQHYVNGREGTPKDVAWEDIPTSILFGLPRIGMTAYKDELLYLYYTTERHGHRGLDPDRVVIHSFNVADLMSLGRRGVRNEVLQQAPFVHIALRTPSTTIADVLARLDKIEGSKALSHVLHPHFGALQSRTAFPILCYKTERIADILGPRRFKLYNGSEKYVPIINRVFGNENVVCEAT